MLFQSSFFKEWVWTTQSSRDLEGCGFCLDLSPFILSVVPFSLWANVSGFTPSIYFAIARLSYAFMSCERELHLSPQKENTLLLGNNCPPQRESSLSVSLKQHSFSHWLFQRHFLSRECSLISCHFASPALLDSLRSKNTESASCKRKLKETEDTRLEIPQRRRGGCISNLFIVKFLEDLLLSFKALHESYMRGRMC